MSDQHAMGVTMSCMKETRPPSNRVSIENDKSIYHEKQSKELCALHALNNLFQDENAFTKKELDDVCYKLSPNTYINPHKSLFGLGNYDINVIIGALQKREFDTVWFDKRKDVENLLLENIEGFILNIPTEYKWGMVKFPLKRKHWVTLRQVGQYYYNLDSKLDAPEVIGGHIELINYLKEQVQCQDKEILLVVNLEISKQSLWYKSTDSEQCSDSKNIDGKEETLVEEKEDLSSCTASSDNLQKDLVNNDKTEESTFLDASSDSKRLAQAKKSETKSEHNGSVLNFSSIQEICQANGDRKSTDTETTSHS